MGVKAKRCAFPALDRMDRKETAGPLAVVIRNRPLPI